MIRQIKTVAIVGAGAWGTAVAKSIAETRPQIKVSIWAYEKSVVASINSFNENEYLPGVKLPSNIRACSNLRDAIYEAEVVLLATPSKVAYDIAQRMSRYITDSMYVGFLTKGFCKVQNEILTISQAIEKAIPRLKDKIAAISGPSHAEEVSRRYHTCLNIGSMSPESRSVIADLLTSDYLQCRETEDIRGVEVGGTLKNPAAIAAGMISVLPHCGDNLAGALISESLKEMIRLGKLFGISEETMIDISGLGDLVTTALSGHSRNRRFGKDIANQIMQKGGTLGVFDRFVLRFRPKSIIERMSKKFNYLAEGAYAIEPLIELAEYANISIPIYRSLYEVLLNKKDTSLLVETIKNPARFNELYYRTKIQLVDRKNGLEKVKGKVFRELILGRVVEKFTARQGGGYDANEVMKNLREFYSAASASKGGVAQQEMRIMNNLTEERYAESVRQLAGLYFDGMTDNFNPVFKGIFFVYITVVQIVNFIFHKGSRILTSGYVKDIKRIKRSVNTLYVARFTGVFDFIFILSSILRKRIPFPRYLIDTRAFGALQNYIFRQLGGFFVDAGMLYNHLYRETLCQYLSILAGHGVPILYFPYHSSRENSELADNEFFSAISESLFRHTAEIALIPVEISYNRKPDSRQAGLISVGEILSSTVYVNFSKPIYLSEYANRPSMITGLAEAINSSWVEDMKIPPHYILCKLLMQNNYTFELESGLKQVKEFISKSGRHFDYSPAKILKRGVAFLVESGVASVSDGRITVENRSDAEYYSNLIN